KVAFGAPDDGWIVGPTSAGGSILYRYDGTSWILCNAHPEQCGDSATAPRVPLASGAGHINGLLAVGSRVYLYGDRVVPRPPGDFFGVTPQHTWPLVIYHDHGGQWTAGEDGDRTGWDPGFSQSPPPAAERNV